MNNYINYNWYRQNPEGINPVNLYDPKEGFLKGNSFKDLYSPYKNYQPMNLTPRSEQEKCLYELSALCFAAHELNLYLDLHPENQSLFLLFQDYQKKADQKKEEYEQKYGPLSVNTPNQKEFDWMSGSWPWEGNNV